MIKMTVKGIDEAKRNLDKLVKKVESVSGKQSVGLSELMNPAFMEEFTSFKNIDELFDKGGFKVESKEDFEAIDENQLDEWVEKNTQFKTWKEMLNKAATNHIAKQIGI